MEGVSRVYRAKVLGSRLGKMEMPCNGTESARERIERICEAELRRVPGTAYIGRHKHTKEMFVYIVQEVAE